VSWFGPVRTATGGMLRHKVQAVVIGMVLLVSTASATLGLALLAATDGPFQQAFAAQNGANLTVTVNPARAGAAQQDLAGLAGEIYARSLPDGADDGPDGMFEDRSVRLETTFDGAGVLADDLTPECAAVVTAVLDALSAPAGAEDARTREQRYHDGLQEAMRRL